LDLLCGQGGAAVVAGAAFRSSPSVFPGHTPGKPGPSLHAAAALVAASSVLAGAPLVGHAAVLAGPPLGDVLGIGEAAPLDVGAPAPVVSHVVGYEVIAHC